MSGTTASDDGVTPVDLLRLANAEFQRYNRHAECGDYEMFASCRMAQQLVAEALERLQFQPAGER